MRPVNKKASKVIDFLTASLGRPYDDDGKSAKKIQNSDGYMAVSVERISNNEYSIAHYGEQNGDLMADPEMTFVRYHGLWFATSLKMDYIGMYRRSMTLDDSDAPVRMYKRLQKDHSVFAGKWLLNIKAQQGL